MSGWIDFNPAETFLILLIIPTCETKKNFRVDCLLVCICMRHGVLMYTGIHWSFHRSLFCWHDSGDYCNDQWTVYDDWFQVFTVCRFLERKNRGRVSFVVWSYHKFLSRYYCNYHRVYLPRGRCCSYTDSETLHFTHRDNSGVRAPAFQVQKQDKTGLMIRNDRSSTKGTA